MRTSERGPYCSKDRPSDCSFQPLLPYSVSLPALSLLFSAFLAAVLPRALSEMPPPCTPAPALALAPLGLSEKLVRSSDWGTPSPSHSWVLLLIFSAPWSDLLSFQWNWGGKGRHVCLVHHLGTRNPY